MEPLESQEPPIARAQRLAYVIFARPSLTRAAEFLRDFGLTVLSEDADRLYLGAPDSDSHCYEVRRETKARFVGLGMLVGAESDLHALIREGHADRIENIAAPGGGKRVRMADPMGFEVHAVVRQASTFADSSARPSPVPKNNPTRTLRVDQTRRDPSQPPPVFNIGHVLFQARRFADVLHWYRAVFGMLVSDVQELPDGSPVTAFLRCDRGDDPADHHTVAIGQSIKNAFDHVAFELADVEAVTQAQLQLADKAWKHAWGIGRHKLGSQVFDYWYDPWGAKHEHYADGDKFTAKMPTGHSAFSGSSLAQWAPPLPSKFLDLRPTPQLIFDIARAIGSGDVPLSKALSLAKAGKQ